MIRHADLGADADVELQREIGTRRRIDQLGGQRQKHAALIDVRDRIAVVQPFRHGEGNFDGAEIARAREIDRRRDAGISRASPVGMPTRIERDLQPATELTRRIDARGNQADACLAVADPRSDGSLSRSKKQGERDHHERAHGQMVVLFHGADPSGGKARKRPSDAPATRSFVREPAVNRRRTRRPFIFPLPC